MSERTFGRIEPRRSATVRSWWARSFLTLAEEAAYDPGDVRKGAQFARRGEVGQIRIGPGSVVASVSERDRTLTVDVTVDEWTPDEAQAFVEVVASASGWIGSLLRAEVPASFDEALEEVGVELLAYGGVGARCTCEPWADPCAHALAVLTQVAWLVETDPLVLVHLRGLDRATLIDRVTGGGPAEWENVPAGADDSPKGAFGTDGEEAAWPDLDVAVEAAETAAALLESVEDAR